MPAVASFPPSRRRPPALASGPRSTETGAAHRAISTHTCLSIHPGPRPLPKLSAPWTRDARGRRPITGASGQQTGSRQRSSQSNGPEAGAGLTRAGNKGKGVGAVTFREAPMPTTLRMGRTGARTASIAELVSAVRLLACRDARPGPASRLPRSRCASPTCSANSDCSGTREVAGQR